MTKSYDKTALEWGLSITEWPNPLKKDPELLGELIKRMNAEHGAVAIGSATKYVRMGMDEAGRPRPEFWTAAALSEYYRGVVVQEAGSKKTNMLEAWASQPDRRQYTGVVFSPGSEMNPPNVPAGAYNLWAGFGVKPVKGDWSKFRAHLLTALCNGHPMHFAWLMDWMADMIQRPQRKVPTCVVIRSTARGIGKSKLGAYLSQIFGHHAAKVSNKDQLFGRFNSHLATAIFCYLEETTFAGSAQEKTRLRDRISETEGLLERKGIDPVPIPIFTRYMIFANEQHVVPADLQERRYFVLDAKWDIPDPDKKAAYFAPIIKQMEEEGGIAAMMHELLHRKITSNLVIAPRTEALREQEAFGLPPHIRTLAKIAREASIDRQERLDLHVLSEELETAVPISDVMAALDVDRHEGNFHTHRTGLGVALKELGVKKVRVRDGRARVESYIFPPMRVFREAMVRILKIDPALISPAPEYVEADDARKKKVGRNVVQMPTATKTNRKLVPKGSPTAKRQDGDI